jgi:hypothetical protein
MSANQLVVQQTDLPITRDLVIFFKGNKSITRKIWFMQPPPVHRMGIKRTVILIV